MANDDDLERLRKAIRTKVREGADLLLNAADARLLLDELGRLQQSNDRLRRQNRRVRLRLQRAGLEGDDATDGDRDEGETPAP